MMRSISILALVLFLSSRGSCEEVKLIFDVVQGSKISLGGFDVNLYQGNRLVKWETFKKSKVKLNIESGSQYVLEVSKDGFYTKRLLLDLRCDSNCQEEIRYRFIVELEERIDAQASTVSSYLEDFHDLPVAILSLGPDHSLEVNEDYANSSHDQLERLKTINWSADVR